VATASSAHTCCGFSTTGAINGNYRGPWGNGEGWNDASENVVPDWIQVDFAGSKSIDEISVFSLHDNYTQENSPTETQTFSLYGLQSFNVQYWNGSSWITIPGGSVTGNNKVWRKFTFSAITTSKIRVYITQVPDSWSRVVEIQAFGTSAGGEKVQWLVADHLGTPRMIIDQTGALAAVKRHDYLPFGEELFAGSGGRSTALGYTGNDGVRQQFTQKERDVETGLDYFEARYYASVQGRFTSVDPITIARKRLADPQSINLYVYSRNNPLKYIDPTGEYFVGANGKRVGYKVNENGKIVLGKNATAALVRMARLINRTGNENALASFTAAATNETKNHFKMEPGAVNNGLVGQHQAHDKNGKPLTWPVTNDGTGKFDGQPAYIKDKNGNMVYKEATITIFTGNMTQSELAGQQQKYNDPALTKSELIIGVFTHEVDHNTNQKAIDAIRDRQEGRPNGLDVEQSAEETQKKTQEEIKDKRPPKKP
ncbi:MAG TPA: RHS repeat-associated core domain-containing protein, partial [Anaerolineales bacterium]|nr:RHS repeat-associated core domain-containing protein [Anaerolineales bacterium]